MPEEVAIQMTLVENGLGQRAVPIYFASFHVPLELYNDDAANRGAFSRMSDAQNADVESSFVYHFTDKNYGREVFYVSSPDELHTASIAGTILQGFGVEHRIAPKTAH